MYYYQSPFGSLRVIEKENKITSISYCQEYKENENIPFIIIQLFQELDEYFNLERTKFSIPIELIGTEFQKKVWSSLKSIPYGKVNTYKQIAIKIGNEKASRAVGNACNKNPLLLLIPCHRVIGSNGSLTGFALGLEIKEQLLELEKRKQS